MYPAHRNLPLLLLHAREAAMSHFRPILKRFGLTEQQWRIMRALGEATEGLEPGQIAEACKIQKPSLTGILSRMVELKWIDRHWSAVDQRRQLVSLTSKGRALVDRMTPLINQQYRLIEDAIGARTLDTIYRTLDSTLTLLNQQIATVGTDAERADAGPAQRTTHRAAASRRRISRNGSRKAA